MTVIIDDDDASGGSQGLQAVGNDGGTVMSAAAQNSTLVGRVWRDKPDDGAMNGVSYIVTVYNKASFLPATIAALAAQQGDFEREFIFVDDGSTDGSIDQLRQLVLEA